MAEFWLNFHFLRPWWLVLLILPIIGFARYFRGQSLHSSWQKIVDERLLSFLLVKGSSKQRKVLSWVALLGLLSAIIAGAGPSWQKIEVPALEAQNPAMILLNMSSDMKVADLSPSRLERAKYKIKDLLGLLQGAQVGMIVYSGEPFVIAPLTDDAKILQNLLPVVNDKIMPLNGDRLDRAIALATERFAAAQYQKGQIIVFAPDVGQNFEDALNEAQKAKANGYTVNVIATVAQRSDKLQQIAKAGGGTYTLLQNNDSDIAPLVQKINHQQSNLSEGKNLHSIWLDYGYYLLFIPMLCCLYFFRQGILMIGVSLLLTTPAQASFFFNANQDGLRAFEAQDYQKAARSFETPEWKAASYYRQGDYPKASAEYAKGKGETALYNQGNALAKGGKIDEAIAKYEEVLKLNPKHEDAKFNLEYLKKQKEQQQDQQQNQSPQNQQQNQGQDNEQNQDQQQQAQSDNQNEEQNPQENNNEEQQSGNQQNQSAEQEQQENNEQQQDESQANAQSPQELDQSEQQEEANEQGGAVTQNAEETDEEYDEKIQARAQQLREIPEDAGGLLRAFIVKEYRKNRYNQ